MRPPSYVFVAVVLTVAAFGGVAVVGADAPAERVPASAASDGPVPVENGSVYWRGQLLSFSVESSGTYEVRTADGGELVAQLDPSDGSASLNTTRLAPGEYVLSRRSSDGVAYRFEVARQALSAAESDGGLVVNSNRGSYPLAVESPNLSADQLRSLFPGAVERNGTVVFTEVGPNGTLSTDRSAVPDGEYEIRLDVLDADATASVSLSVSSPGTRTTVATTDGSTDRTATDSTTRRTGRSTADRTTAGSTTPATSATTVTPTSPEVPGLGLPTAVLAVALVLGLAAATSRR